MTRSTDNPWLHRFSLLTAMATLFLIWVGGLVTSHGVGMSVPDWPTTYGYNMFFFPVARWMGGIFYEHSHRLAASAVGMLTAALTAWIWARESNGWPRRIALMGVLATMGLLGVRTQPMFIALACVAVLVIVFSSFQMARDERRLRWWAAIGFSAVIIQGVLGGLRVTSMNDALGVFHATLAQVFFALICSIALATSPWWSRQYAGERSPRNPATWRMAYAVVTALVLGQLMLGAAMRHQHAGLAIPDFPAAYGRVWPATDPVSVAKYNQERREVRALNPVTAGGIVLQMAHRLTALVIILSVTWLAGATWRRLGARSVAGRLAMVWLGLLLAQAGLGMATIWTNKAADVATAHVAVGALSLMTGTLLTLVTAKRGRVNAPCIPKLAVERGSPEPQRLRSDERLGEVRTRSNPRSCCGSGEPRSGNQDSSLTREPVRFEAREIRVSA